MEFTALLLALLLQSCIYTYTVHASLLSVDPNRSQFFKYESLSLSCDESTKSSEWTVKAKTIRGVSECGRDWGSLQSSSCVIDEVYSWNSGVYWCESASGETGPAANITVTENNVILESPVSPVLEGESVTLRCTTQSNSSTMRPSIFMKDRSAVGAAMTGQVTISAVSTSDEGLYMCMVTDIGASAESWLTVIGQRSDGFTKNVTQESIQEDEVVVSEGPVSAAGPFLIYHLVVGTPYLVSTILLALVCRDKAKSQRAESTRNSDETQMAEII